jgi:hypothetical protein
MGVLKSPRQKVRIEDVPVDYRDYIFNSDSEFETDSENGDIIAPADAQAIRDAIAQDEKKKKKSRHMRVLRRFQRAGGQIGHDGVNIKSNMGARKRRRVENAHLILNHADKDDICEDFSDLVPHTITAFTRLFLDKSSMKMWQSFMDKSEEEQEKFIQELDDGPSSSEDSFEHVIGGSPVKLPKRYNTMTNEEKRSYHPAYSARACFDRLHGKFRSALTRNRGVPFQMVDDLENKLRQFYQENPNGVWVDVVEGSHTRIYVHAIANYLSLTSSSLIGDGGGKMVEIRNPKKIFMPPYECLVPYLHRRKGKSLCLDDGVNF